MSNFCPFCRSKAINSLSSSPDGEDTYFCGLCHTFFTVAIFRKADLIEQGVINENEWGWLDDDETG